MKTSNEYPRVRRQRCLSPELLEDRVVLSSGQGSTFAITPATITTAGQASSTSFTMASSLFTPATKMHGKMMLGIDVTAITPSSSSSGTSSTTATLFPKIVSVTSSTGQVIKIQSSRYDRQIARANHLTGEKAISSAVLLDIPVPSSTQAPVTYTVQVQGLNHTTGQYLLGFYLPGDANGDGTVNKTDITTIKSLIGDTATNSNYSFDADVNRDGIINQKDIRLAKQNMGASTKVDPVASVNLDPASDPSLDRTSPYSTVHFAGTVTPDATVTFANNSNNGATTTVTADSTGAYSIMVPLVSGSNTFTVTTHDGFGQSISGQISPVAYDPNSPTTAPSPTSTGS
jgi:Dockerin type I domain